MTQIITPKYIFKHKRNPLTLRKSAISLHDVKRLEVLPKVDGVTIRFVLVDQPEGRYLYLPIESENKGVRERSRGRLKELLKPHRASFYSVLSADDIIRYSAKKDYFKKVKQIYVYYPSTMQKVISHSKRPNVIQKIVFEKEVKNENK